MSKSHFIQLLFFLFFFLSNIADSVAQEGLGIETIRPLLKKMNLEFFTPTENQTKFVKPRKNDFFDYETNIKFKSNELEVLLALYPDNEEPLTSNFPHLAFNRLLANLVPNDDEQEVLVVGWREDKLSERNADWGAEAYMKTRKAISNFPFAKLIAFYKEGYGMVVMLYCFNKPEGIPFLLGFE